jgi:hypothetical protein
MDAWTKQPQLSGQIGRVRAVPGDLIFAAEVEPERLQRCPLNGTGASRHSAGSERFSSFETT